MRLSSTLGTIASTCESVWYTTIRIRLINCTSHSLHTLHRFYLLRVEGDVVERPQFLYMRVAVALHGRNLGRVLSTYELLSQHAYTAATPTLYNAGTTSQYLASCYIYQPPLGSAVSVMQHSVAALDDLWCSDGGVGMSLGTVPARL